MIWLNDIGILWKKPYVFFPTNKMKLTEQMNSLIRLSFYISITITILKRNINYLWITPIIMILNACIIYLDPRFNKLEGFNHNDICEPEIHKKKNWRFPTKDNPFMNTSLIDINDDPNSESIIAECPDNINIKQQIKKSFDEDLYKNVSDVFGKNNSSRQFYTMPNTSTPNDQKAFAEWCYGKTDKHCKEGNGKDCFRTTLQDPETSLLRHFGN